MIVKVYLPHIFRCLNLDSKSPQKYQRNKRYNKFSTELKAPPHITFWLILLPQKLGVFKRKANEERGSWHPGGDRSVSGLLEGSGDSTCPGDPKWCCCSEKKIRQEATVICLWFWDVGWFFGPKGYTHPSRNGYVGSGSGWSWGGDWKWVKFLSHSYTCHFVGCMMPNLPILFQDDSKYREICTSFVNQGVLHWISL